MFSLWYFVGPKFFHGYLVVLTPNQNQRSYFCVSFAKFLRTPPLQNIFWWRLLIFLANVWHSTQMPHDCFWAFYCFFYKLFNCSSFLLKAICCLLAVYWPFLMKCNMKIRIWKRTNFIKIVSLKNSYPFAKIDIWKISPIGFGCKSK